MFGNTNKTQGLLKKSSGVLDLFRKTIADIAVVNKEMSLEEIRLADEQAEINRVAAEKVATRQTDRDLLNAEIADNDNVAKKIESFWKTPVFDNHKLDAKHLDTSLGSEPKEEEGHDPEEETK